MTEEEIKQLMGQKRQDTLNMVGEATRNPAAMPIKDMSIYDQLRQLKTDDTDYQETLRQKLMELAAKRKM